MSDFLTTALAAVAGFFGKSLWDLYWKRAEDRASLARQKRIDLLEKQLSLFYWPLYIQLQANNVVWQHLVSGQAIDQEVKGTVDKYLYDTYFLPNHEQMVRTIETNIHLAQADAELERLLLKLIRHVAIFKALRESGIRNIDPIALGEPWPAELFRRIEARTRQLQEQLDVEIRSQRPRAVA